MSDNTECRDIIDQAGRDGLVLARGAAPDKLKLSGPTDAITKWKPIIAQRKAELLAALSAPPDDRADLEADAAARVITTKALALAAHPDRTAFALKNHADAIRHFRRMALETDRLAETYRTMIEEHTEAARKRLTPTEFDTWLSEIGEK